MKDFLMATIGGLGICLICNGLPLALILMLRRELEKQERNMKK